MPRLRGKKSKKPSGTLGSTSSICCRVRALRRPWKPKSRPCIISMYLMMVPEVTTPKSSGTNSRTTRVLANSSGPRERSEATAV